MHGCETGRLWAAATCCRWGSWRRVEWRTFLEMPPPALKSASWTPPKLRAKRQGRLGWEAECTAWSRRKARGAWKQAPRVSSGSSSRLALAHGHQLERLRRNRRRLHQIAAGGYQSPATPPCATPRGRYWCSRVLCGAVSLACSPSAPSLCKSCPRTPGSAQQTCSAGQGQSMLLGARSCSKIEAAALRRDEGCRDASLRTWRSPGTPGRCMGSCVG